MDGNTKYHLTLTLSSHSFDKTTDDEKGEESNNNKTLRFDYNTAYT